MHYIASCIVKWFWLHACGNLEMTSLKQCCFIIHIHHEWENYSASWNWLFSSKNVLVNESNVVESSLFTVRLCHKKKVSDFIIGRMIPWLAPGLLKGVYKALLYTSTNALTKTHKHTQQNSTSLMHLTEQGRPRFRASSALLPMCYCFLPLSLSFYTNVQLSLSSLPADRWSSG